MKFMKKNHNLLIGERTAEELKINIGTASPRAKSIKMECRGRDLITGLPKTISVTSEEMLEALQEPVNGISDAVNAVLGNERCFGKPWRGRREMLLGSEVVEF